MDQIRYRPEECLFIDDLEANVRGARDVGRHAILFVDLAQLQRDLDEALREGWELF